MMSTKPTTIAKPILPPLLIFPYVLHTPEVRAGEKAIGLFLSFEPSAVQLVLHIPYPVLKLAVRIHDVAHLVLLLVYPSLNI